MIIENESNPDPESTSSEQAAPAQQSFAEPLGSRHQRISETPEGKVQLNSAAPMTESRQQLFDDLSKAAAELDEDASFNPPQDEDAEQNANAESLGAAEPPTEPSVASNKRDKDTEKAYQRAKDENAKLKKELETKGQLDPQQFSTYKEFYEKGLPVLKALDQLAQVDPQRFQQLFDGAQAGPRVPSQEEMEEIQSDPAKYKEYLKSVARELLKEEIYNVPEIAKLKTGYSNVDQVRSFIATRFEGNNKHPDLLAAEPYMSRVIAEHQQRREPITLDKAYAEYLRAKEHFASTGTAGKASNNGKAKPSSSSPESFPQQPTTPLPSKYPGVAARVTDPFAGMQGMTRRQKIEELGKRLSSRRSTG